MEKLITQPLSMSPWPVQILVMLILATIIWAMVWWFIRMQAKSTGKSYSEHIWPIISKNPWCVVIQRLGVYALALGCAYIAFSRFA